MRIEETAKNGIVNINNLVQCEDVCDLTKNVIPEDYYDLIIDKGCLDCLMTDNQYAVHSFTNGIREIYKCLKPESELFVYISTGRPDKRISLSTGTEFKVKIDIEEIGNCL
jgi:hypothetical protein